MHAQSKLRVSECPRTLMEQAGGLGTWASPPYPSVAAAAEVLSAPRKWPQGSGWGPLRDSSAPLGAPPSTPARGSCCSGGGGEPETRGGLDGLDKQKQQGWGPEGDSVASLLM